MRTFFGWLAFLLFVAVVLTGLWGMSHPDYGSCPPGTRVRFKLNGGEGIVIAADPVRGQYRVRWFTDKAIYDEVFSGVELEVIGP